VAVLAVLAVAVVVVLVVEPSENLGWCDDVLAAFFGANEYPPPIADRKRRL
jgi:hypothetical protein